MYVHEYHNNMNCFNNSRTVYNCMHNLSAVASSANATTNTEKDYRQDHGRDSPVALPANTKSHRRRRIATDIDNILTYLSFFCRFFVRYSPFIEKLLRVSKSDLSKVYHWDGVLNLKSC